VGSVIRNGSHLALQLPSILNAIQAPRWGTGKWVFKVIIMFWTN